MGFFAKRRKPTAQIREEKESRPVPLPPLHVNMIRTRNVPVIGPREWENPSEFQYHELQWAGWR